MPESNSANFFSIGMPAGIVPVTRVRPGEESDRPASRDKAEQTARAVEAGQRRFAGGRAGGGAPLAGGYGAGRDDRDREGPRQPIRICVPTGCRGLNAAATGSVERIRSIPLRRMG